eukprot:TRINITY_DN47358_c0_g1_i1.p1 TRINITY_DN47358_c0_g1~~TRINITY_DN47358_c0_g1_i1.p1  ORF type:complete len:1125 (+),score=399.39 TRINITY_DN47358_c0_g1_i1:109-3483(+)
MIGAQTKAGYAPTATLNARRQVMTHACWTGGTGLVESQAKIHFVDLAGSEQQKKTGATGERLKEGIGINLSLTTLGRVIHELTQPGKGGVPPFRDSKLTMVLKDALMGNSRTMILAAISPVRASFSETVSTLEFATRCKLVKTSASKNLNSKADMLAKMKAEKEFLQAQLANEREKIEELDQKISGHSAELAESERLAAEERQEKATLQGKLAATAEELARSQAEHLELRKDTEEKRQKLESAARQRSKEKGEENASLQELLQDKEEQLAKLQADLEVLSQEQLSAEEEVKGLQAEREVLLREREEKDKDIHKLREGMAELKEEARQQLTDLEKACRVDAMRLQDEMQKLSDVKLQQEEKAASAMQAMEQQLRSSCEEVELLKGRLAKEQDEVAVLVERCSEGESKAEMMEKELSARRTDHERLTQQHTELAQEMTQLREAAEHLQAQLEEEQTEHDAVARERDELLHDKEERMKRLEGAQEEAAQVGQQRARLEAELDRVQAERDRLVHDCEAAQDTVSELRRQLSEQHSSRQRLASEHDEALSQTAARISALESANAELLKEKQERLQQLHKVQDEISQLQQQHSADQSELERLQAETEQLAHDREEALVQLESLQEETAVLKEQLQAEHNKAGHLEEQVQALRQEKEERSKRLQGLQDELEQLQAERERVQRDRAACSLRAEELRKETERLKGVHKEELNGLQNKADTTLQEERAKAAQKAAAQSLKEEQLLKGLARDREQLEQELDIVKKQAVETKRELEKRMQDAEERFRKSLQAQSFREQELQGTLQQHCEAIDESHRQREAEMVSLGMHFVGVDIKDIPDAPRLVNMHPDQALQGLLVIYLPTGETMVGSESHCGVRLAGSGVNAEACVFMNDINESLSVRPLGSTMIRRNGNVVRAGHCLELSDGDLLAIGHAGVFRVDIPRAPREDAGALEQSEDDFLSAMADVSALEQVDRQWENGLRKAVFLVKSDYGTEAATALLQQAKRVSVAIDTANSMLEDTPRRWKDGVERLALSLLFNTQGLPDVCVVAQRGEEYSRATAGIWEAEVFLADRYPAMEAAVQLAKAEEKPRKEDWPSRVWSEVSIKEYRALSVDLMLAKVKIEKADRRASLATGLNGH